MDNSTIPDNSTTADAGDDDSCGGGSPYNGRLGLRVAAIFIILVTSIFGTLFPIVTRRFRGTYVPVFVFEFAKYFGSGVIIATAFIHLLSPANEELLAPCLTGVWTLYAWPEAIAMASVFMLFLIEVIAFRWGQYKLRKIGVQYHAHSGHDGGPGDSHPHNIGGAITPSGAKQTGDESSGGADESGHDFGRANSKVGGQGIGESNDIDPLTDLGLKVGGGEVEKSDLEQHAETSHADDAAAQILAAAILEFGVIFHSVVIGLTLAVDDNFVTLFIVIIFHQMFEGLGLGSRLSQLPLPRHMSWILYASGIAYACVTPLGLAIGLGVRTTYNPNSKTANIVSGVLDAFSAGVLLYTGLVELLAHDFIFNKHMMKEASTGKLVFSIGCVIVGAGIMALLGRWA